MAKRNSKSRPRSRVNPHARRRADEKARIHGTSTLDAPRITPASRNGTGSRRTREQRQMRFRGYPRPMLERKQWTNLNGFWDFCIDANADFRLPREVEFDRQILVPFSPETPASGVHDTGFYKAVWYRRKLPTLQVPPGHRVMLHFGASDYATRVWVNETMVVEHHGGYTPFFADITAHLRRNAENVVVVRAEDDPHELAKPRGKQDWQFDPHSIWYPRTTGIWQTVWIEVVPESFVERLRWTPNVERWEISLEARVAGKRKDGLKLRARLHVGDVVLADDTYLVVRGEVNRRIALSDPGIDDYRNELLWYPHTPTLIHADLELLEEDGSVIDRVRSYTALRSIGVQGDRFVLNGRPYFLRMVLDQGYWPDTGLSSPDDNALRRDVELIKAMGFNGARRHQKISDPRYLFWCDTLGLLLWEEMPSPYRFNRHSVRRLTREWAEVINRDISHPCIIAWVPFNESWGVPDLPDSPAQRHCVQALYHLTKTLDPTRPVIGNDGWESVATDIIGIHDYDADPKRIVARYYSEDGIDSLFRQFRPGGRMLLVGDAHTGQPIMITEFGGIAFTPAKQRRKTWGYSRVQTAAEFRKRYTELLEAMRSLPLLAGFCYTQFADTYQEANGLVYADRTPKVPLAQIAMATGGQEAIWSQQAETAWRRRMMNTQREQYLVPEQDHAMASR